MLTRLEQRQSSSRRPFGLVFLLPSCIAFALVSQLYYGSLMAKDYVPNRHLEHDKAPGRTNSLLPETVNDPTTARESAGLHVVVSHCRCSVGWIFDQYLPTLNKTVKSATIYSKCGATPENAPAWALIVDLPNVGRCDHSYAYWINQVVSDWNVHGHSSISRLSGNSTILPQDRVVFLKDTNNTYRRTRSRQDAEVPLGEMWNQTLRTGYSCGSRVIWRAGFRSAVPTNVLHFDTLASFAKDSYISPADSRNNKLSERSLDIFPAVYRPLSNWTQQYLNLSLEPPGLIHACFGGVFMTTVESMLKAPVKNWEAVVSSLSRGDNIEEGHYMERMWPAILAPGIPLEEQVRLMQRKERVIQRPGLGYHGLLLLRNESHDEGFS
jgi:hypothetical protein